MVEVELVLSELGLLQYLSRFVEEGFDTWDTVIDITEDDLDALGVKLGHRRYAADTHQKLQRRIANARGPSYEPLAAASMDSGSIEPTLDRESPVKSRIGKGEERLSSGSVGKRKYRRHPKPDENAPERPPSAYVLFSNKMREELRSQNLSFTDTAKVIGESWQALSPESKEPYESQAAATKAEYHVALAKYKLTEDCNVYARYLEDFRAKYPATRSGKHEDLHLGDFTNSKPDEKRAKIDAESGSSANVSPKSPSEGFELKGSKTSGGRRRLGSIDSTGGQSMFSSQASSHGSSLSITASSLLEYQPGVGTQTSSQTTASHRPQSYYKDPTPGTSFIGPIQMQIAGEEVMRLPPILSKEERYGELDKSTRLPSYSDKMSSFEGQPTRRTATPSISQGAESSNQSSLTGSSSPLYSSFSSVEEGFILPPLSSMAAQLGSGSTHISANREPVFQKSNVHSLAFNPPILAPHIPFSTPPSADIPQSGPSLGKLSLASPLHALSLPESKHNRTSAPREIEQSHQYQQPNQQVPSSAKLRSKHRECTGLAEVDTEMPDDPLSVLAFAGTIVGRNREEPGRF